MPGWSQTKPEPSPSRMKDVSEPRYNRVLASRSDLVPLARLWSPQPSSSQTGPGRQKMSPERFSDTDRVGFGFLDFPIRSRRRREKICREHAHRLAPTCRLGLPKGNSKLAVPMIHKVTADRHQGRRDEWRRNDARLVANQNRAVARQYEGGQYRPLFCPNQPASSRLTPSGLRRFKIVM